MPSKADVKAWKAQLVAQAEQQILKLTDSDQFKKYLNTLGTVPCQVDTLNNKN